MTRSEGGTYALFFLLEEGFSQDVGSLGRLRFARGVYVYAGSAMSGFEARLLRHARRDKRVHWHIDRLTSRAECRVVGAVTFGNGELDECAIVEAMLSIPWVEMGPARFGASDHACGGHLVVLGERPELVDRAVGALVGRGGAWLSFDGIERPGGPE
jgi:Uri superfamily endonuclease